MRTSPSLIRLRLLQSRGLLVSLGEDDSTVRLKLWKLDSWGKTVRAPQLARSIDVFTAREVAADITLLATFPGPSPQLTHAVGLENGNVIIIKADAGQGLEQASFPITMVMAGHRQGSCSGCTISAGKDRIARTQVNVRPSNSDQWQVTGLGFSGTACLQMQQQQHVHLDLFIFA